MSEVAAVKISGHFSGSLFYIISMAWIVVLVTCQMKLPSEHYNLTVVINPRIFVSYFWDETLTDHSIVIYFRWSTSTAYSADRLSFFNVSVFDLKKRLHSTYIVPAIDRQHEMPDAPKNALFSFTVKGCWELFCGPDTDPVWANTSVVDPPPVLTIVESKEVKFYFPDTKVNLTTLNQSVSAISIITYDDSMFWVNNLTNEVVMDTGRASDTLMTLQNEVLSLTVDWIGRSLFWLEKLNLFSCIMKYDISRPQEKPTPVIISDESVNGSFHTIQLDPYQSMLYFSWSHPNETISIARFRYNDGQKIEGVLGLRSNQNSNEYRSCNCSLTSLHPVFVLDQRKNEINDISLYVVDVRTWVIWGSDRDGCGCRVIRNVSIMKNPLGLVDYPHFSLTVDYNRLYWIRTEPGSVLYSINKYTGNDFRAEFQTSVSISFILGYNVVPLPARDCLRVRSQNQSIELVNATSSGLFLRFSMIISRWRHCAHLSLPSVYYVLQYSEINNSTVRTIEPIYETEIMLNDLRPFTSYLISIGASNYFVSLWKNYTMGSPVLFRTKAGIPLAPVNFSVRVLTPNALAVNWCMTIDPNHDLMEIVYAVEWVSENSSDSRSNGTVWISNPRQSRCFTEMIQGLKESQIYEIRVLAYDSELTGYVSTQSVVVKTFQHPNPVRLLSATKSSLCFAWNSPSDGSVHWFSIEYAEVNENEEDLFWLKHLVDGALMEVAGPNIESIVTIVGLKSDQAYAIRTAVFYYSEELYTWPTTNFSIFYTLRQDQESLTLTEAFLIPVFVLLILTFIAASLVIVIRKFRWKHRQTATGCNTDKSSHQVTSDLEVTKFYAINHAPNYENVITPLQNFSQDQVQFSRFVDEIENGDLFEGVVDEVLESDGKKKLPVILRTINKDDLCEKELKEQMKEIVLMNQMKHKNIISMLGACLLGNPQILVFEFPDCGDLLSFLRNNQAYSLHELLNFCLEIVCGCQFFEDRRLVHRDLRARNCFVFSRSCSSYDIKIGGFSLAKGIYRTEDRSCSSRELPVEWMAPEAIADGLFTGMSDVWAFGVLLWEIFSGGMHPYSEICSKSELLLQFLNSGNRLKKPNQCPQDVFFLMLSCWRSSPFNRPSFHYVADQLSKANEMTESKQDVDEEFRREQ